MDRIDYKTVFDRLADDESKICFNARKNYLSCPSLSAFYSIIRKTGTRFRFRELDGFPGINTITGWVFWGGADDILEYHRLVLTDAGFDVKGPDITCDECLNLVLYHGYGVLAVSDIPVPKNIPPDRICYVKDHLVGRCGWQYFDYFQPHKGECFLDGGGLDGNTTIQFIKWSRGDFENIYVFEPNPLEKENCRLQLETLPFPSIHFFDKALWNKDESLLFQAYADSRWDAHIDENGQYELKGVTVDSVLGNRKISFLKLDVEGAEEKALQGAKNHILAYRPRMAISIYHEPLDFIRIPLYLLSLIPDYCFAIRHYHSDPIETILYVF